MEINIATIMRELANKANDEKEKQRMAQHIEFVERKVVPYLQEIAKKGGYQTDFPTPGYSTAIVRDLLQQNGFTVEIFKYSNSRYLVVKW